ncbi:site-specific integrase [Pseudomonas sp. DP-17]|uniref:site-specific integrase n=1 Tax=Pseudomonas sp. DP-17 TaxID=1580486 RepID=UPI001EFAF40D|nr:site-specific integrase [Pseudomonas sp. DP-17]MCG8909840.1 site-specific integrase [Pseudomonas sp. DP-17]
MQVRLVPNCCAAKSELSKLPILIDVYLIIDDNERPLWHENLFLIDAAQEYGANTCKAYANDLLSFVKATKHLGGWSKVKKRDMTGYVVGDLIQARNYAESTTSRHLSSIRKFYVWLGKMGYGADANRYNWNYKKYYSSRNPSPTIKKPDFSDLHSTYIDPETYKELLGTSTCQDIFIKSRDRISLRLGYEVGTRAAETLTINRLMNRPSCRRHLRATDPIGSYGAEAMVGEALSEHCDKGLKI